MQPVDFKAILKDGIRCLTRNCAFHQGYMPVDVQTEYFIRLLVKSATKLNKPHYVVRLQKDTVLQKEVCDLVSPYLVPPAQGLIHGALSLMDVFHTIAPPSSGSHLILSHMGMDLRMTSQHGQNKSGTLSTTTGSSLSQKMVYVLTTHHLLR